ncbi:hypothetical protein Plav_0809 [Parvibaculum lavamentivorans DS-1]|uniref:DUF2946 domain-containing protein n=1 Tax=Parvibaculum lavamentivorans (strain DS-1 / DSM 13023 / NCIMB 13966) TaxID=402881 RepID=A7HR99_PARL1|nr:DUF2946 family protein [Parvibaculum lavamentivorans]ABS62432.1 hypothetical protein Plav_0809 [Parvibaculum lavamentivorans DS-1]
MGTNSSYGLNRRARFGAGPLLALLAIFLHVAAPLAFQLSSTATQDLLETVICSGGEAKTVYIDAEGNPVEPASPGKASHDCKSCVHHCAATLASHLMVAGPAWALPAPLAAVYSVASGVFASTTHPRAPPA